MRNHKYEGKWWLSGRPADKLHGELIFRPENGGLLKVITYRRMNHEDISTPVDIFGISTDGRKITLCNCLLRRTVGHHRPYDKTETTEIEFLSPLIFIGVHANDNLKFRSLSVRFKNFDNWLNMPAFKISSSNVVVNTPESITIAVNKDLQLTIGFVTKLPRTNYSGTKLFAKRIASLIFQPTEERTFSEFYPIVMTFQNFLTLATSQATHPMAINGNTENSKNDEIYQPVKILFQTHSKFRLNTLQTYEMLFGIRPETPKFERLIELWFAKADLMKPIHDLYFSTIYKSGIYTTSEFLNLIQALEAYHRRFLKNEQMPKETYEERVNLVLERVPEYKRWLEYKLAYNEPPLSQRLTDILHYCVEAQGEYIKNQDVFVNNTANTRNYLVHFDDRLKDKAVKGKQLFELVLKLRILVQVCMFKELELEPEVIERLVRRLIQQKYNGIDWS